MFLAYTGAFFTLSYSPLKAIIQGTPKALWPAPMTKLNAVGMPTTAMWLQCLLVSLFILLVSFGGDTASAFYNKLTLMANVSMTLPYLFLALAFPFFKSRPDLERPFVVFKTRAATLLATGVVVLVVTFANVFTIIQPVIEAGDWNSARSREGRWHKVGEIVAVVAAFMCDLALKIGMQGLGIKLPIDYETLFGPLVTMWYIFTEIGSIAENAQALGAPVPNWLTSGIKKLKDKTDDIGNK